LPTRALASALCTVPVLCPFLAGRFAEHLGENPPSSLEITKRVRRRCR